MPGAVALPCSALIAAGRKGADRGLATAHDHDEQGTEPAWQRS
jgi:hypothetical protein